MRGEWIDTLHLAASVVLPLAVVLHAMWRRAPSRAKRVAAAVGAMSWVMFVASAGVWLFVREARLDRVAAGTNIADIQVAPTLDFVDQQDGGADSGCAAASGPSVGS